MQNDAVASHRAVNTYRNRWKHLRADHRLEVEWCDTVWPKDVDELRSMKVGQPWACMATWNPFWLFGRDGRADGHWAGWVYAVDADTPAPGSGP